MNRYRQQMVLPEIGLTGQEKIKDSKVLIVGAGGLGVVVASYLAAMGIGTLGIIDFDVVEESNLHRQFLYTPMDFGKMKAVVLSQKLSIQNEKVEIIAITSRFSTSNAQVIIDSYDIVCDCSDDLNTRMELDKFCELNNKPLVHGAVSDWQGYLTVFHHHGKYRYNDLFQKEKLFDNLSCSMNGTSSPVCGVIGSYMANEVMKICLNIDSVLDGKLLYMNGLSNTSRVLRLKHA
ncbi:MAG: HesA/MoeB/ThiF family protein [Bacteroidetes bacterium]|nr:HesA/MoeB/ThiF family protein [Bacteroidota bacterium]